MSFPATLPGFVAFDPAGYTHSQVTCINTSGVAAGNCSDSSYNSKGFVRAADGTITIFGPSTYGTQPTCINDAGVIGGYYVDSGGAQRLFVIGPPYGSGDFTSISPAGWETSGDPNTMEIRGINSSGTVCGFFYLHSGGGEHGFVLAPPYTASPTILNDPSGHTYVFGINDSGMVTGQSTHGPSSMYSHGFVASSPYSSFTDFDVTGGSITGSTCGYAINNSGVVVGAGVYGSPSLPCFVRAADGTITTFDPSVGAGYQCLGLCINSSGVVAGGWRGTPWKGFIAVAPYGPTNITAVPDPPGTYEGTGNGTVVFAINAGGVPAGDYSTGSFIFHSFIGWYTPPPPSISGTANVYLLPLFIGGLDARVQQFGIRYISTMGDYSDPLHVTVTTPPPDPPELTLGAKMATHVVLQLSPANYDTGPFANQARKDILSTTLQYSHDSAFVTGVFSLSAAGNITEANFVVPDSIADWYVQGQRADGFGNGGWGPTLTVPLVNIIDSGFMRGQGSIIPALDSLVTALFTYTATSIGGGGPNTGEIVVIWPTFEIEYADTSMQVLVSGGLDSGATLAASGSGPTNYNLFPKVAPINGSPVEFDNPSGVPGGWCIPDSSADLVTAAADVQRDGEVSLGGSDLSFVAIVPAAGGGGGGGGSGGGGGGGHQCIVFGEKVVVAARGETPVELLAVGDLVLGADPETGLEQWNAVESLAFGEADCVALSIKEDKCVKLSKSALCPVRDDLAVAHKLVRAGVVNGRHSMFRRGVSYWQQVSGLVDLGPLRVVQVKLRPRPWMLVNGILLHNSLKIQTN